MNQSVIAKGVNDAGRGLNIVVVGNGKEVLKTAHFDTYQEGMFSQVVSLFIYPFERLNPNRSLRPNR